MVQVFGNRIIGGIGAPDSRAAEAFGAGVSTTLGQRNTRQAMDERAQSMRLRDVDLQWATEDREEAKRRRAAAEAAAGAARARQERLSADLIRVYGVGAMQPVAGLTVPLGAAPGRDRQGTAAPAPAPAVGVRVPPRPQLSYGSATAGGGGERTSSAFPEITNVEPVQGTYDRSAAGSPSADALGAPAAYAAPSGAIVVPAAPIGRPGDFAARAAEARLGAIRTGQAAIGYEAAPQLQARALQSQFQNAQAELADAEAAFRDRPTGATAARASAARAEVNRLAPIVQGFLAATAQYPRDRDLISIEGPGATGRERQYVDPRDFIGPPVGPAAPTEVADAAAPPTVTIQGPNGPVTVPVGGGTFSMGSTAGVVGPAVDPEGLGTASGFTFGPRLGFTDTERDNILTDEFISRVGIDPTYTPPRMGTPGAPRRAIVEVMRKRDQLAQLAQAYLAAGETAQAIEIQGLIEAETAKLEAAVARQAIAEARDFNAPQRLSAIWSYHTSREYDFRPSADGGLDVYVDGQLVERGRPIAGVAEETLLMSDQAFAARQAEIAAMQEDAYAESFGESMGAVPAEQEMAAFQADVDVTKQQVLSEIDVTKQQVLSEIELDKDFGIKLNETNQKRLEYALSLDGKLPLEGPEFRYEKLDTGGIAVFDGSRLVAEYLLEETDDGMGGTMVVLRERVAQ